ncbi:MAG: UDP-glucose/GDP-mannose dehydrogenase family protein [Myxococcota bacterium]|nr:UDP-glucose/GDP-mannose dehydrogenase family protein [Myxococcota bacterium]
MKVTMVGGGYVGLVSGAGFAETGNDVICADIDASKIERLEAGEIPIYEPGLDDLIERNVREGRMTFSADVPAAVKDAHVIFIAVGTPMRSDGAADLSAVDAVAQTVAEHAERETVLVCKSTVPVGTNARVKRLVKDAKVKIHVVSNPEFLKEGSAVNDFLYPDRIVVGVDPDDEFARDAMRRLYHPLSLAKDRLVIMDPPSAELTKYVANTMLAMRISFMNEIAGLCEKVGADVHQVRMGVGSDVRIGSKFLYAGPGYGGSCFPKDVKALVHTARDHGLELDLAAATDKVNVRQKGILFRKLKQHFDGDVRGKRVAVWGIAFKPRTDDLRESPALTLIDALLADGATVVAHDPEGAKNAKEMYGDKIEIAEDAYAAAKGADALVLCTEWRQYQNPDFERLKELLNRPLLLDGRNIWSGYGTRKMGFTYEGVGVQGS